MSPLNCGHGRGARDDGRQASDPPDAPRRAPTQWLLTDREYEIVFAVAREAIARRVMKAIEEGGVLSGEDALGALVTATFEAIGIRTAL